MLELLSDIIRNSRFAVRPLPSPCYPHGPNLKRSPWVKVWMAGNELNFRLPRHAPRSPAEQRTAKGDIVDQGVSRQASNGVMGDDRWEFFDGVYRQWRFNGPWFSGEAGAVSFSLRVIHPVKPNHNISFYHPSVFEHTLASYLSSRFAHKTREGQCLWQAPVNWRSREGLPVLAARFDALPNEEGSPVHYCVFPVGDHYLAEIRFSFEQACAGFMAEKDQKISREPMWELVNNVLDSMTLTLSPENQAKVDKIRAECPAYAVSDTFPPLQWSNAGYAAAAEVLSAPGLMSS